VSLAKASIDSGSAAARLEAFCRTTVRLAADGRDDANASPS
jgi:hypothetical protein